MKKYWTKIGALLTIVAAITFTSCKKDKVVQSVVADGPQPTSAFTYVSGTTANPLTVTFTSTAANAESYYWMFGDGTTSTEKAPSHTYAATGTYNVTLKTASAAGYTSVSTPQSILAAAPATAVFGVDNSKSFGINIVFSNQSASVKSVVWDFGDGTTSTDLAPTHKFASATTPYNIKLIVTGVKDDVVSLTKTLTFTDNNLLKGGDMEASSSTFWKIYSSAIATTFGNTGAKPTAGYDANLKFASTTATSGNAESLIYQGVQVTAGQKYLLNAQVKLPAGGRNDVLQFYISTDANTWVENFSDAKNNVWLALNNYHAWGTTSNSTTAIDGDMVSAMLLNGQYGLGVATSGVYTAPITGTVYIGIKAGVYSGLTNGDFLIDNVSFTPVP
jgi:PKD repeat protein